MFNKTTNSSGWEKVLWRQQSYSDNYTGDNFLEALVVTVDAPRATYWQVVARSLSVTQQICVSIILACTAYNLHQGYASSTQLIYYELIIAVLGVIIHTLCNLGVKSAPTLSWQSTLFGAIQTVGVVLLAAILSPLYATLTASISSDTILACTCFLLLIRLYLHDYSGAGFDHSFTTSFGLACGLCASILMSSQLQSTSDVLALMLLSLQFYVTAPYIIHEIPKTVPFGRLLLTAGVVSVAVMLLLRHSIFLTAILVCALVFVSLVCPMWLVRIHKFKARINGPWDEAYPVLSSHLQQT